MGAEFPGESASASGLRDGSRGSCGGTDAWGFRRRPSGRCDSQKGDARSDLIDQEVVEREGVAGGFLPEIFEDPGAGEDAAGAADLDEVVCEVGCDAVRIAADCGVEEELLELAEEVGGCHAG